MLHSKLILHEANLKYAELKGVKGLQMPSDQIKALCEALVETINEELEYILSDTQATLLK
jgi:hypothetical protein